MASLYPDVLPWIQDCLQERADGVEDEFFDRHIGSVLRQILTRAGLSYASLTGDDKDRVDEAAGLRTAARLHGTLLTGGVSTQLRSEDDGASKRAYDGDITAEWLAQANVALRGTSFGAVVSAVSLYAVNGPSRSRCATYDRRPCDAPCEPRP